MEYDTKTLYEANPKIAISTSVKIKHSHFHKIQETIVFGADKKERLRPNPSNEVVAEVPFYVSSEI